MAQLAGQPVVILPEGTQRYVGRDAQRLNILAARIIAETVRTTLGPKVLRLLNSGEGGR